MRLKRLAISNCSRIKDIDIEVRDSMVLIGPNGSGKTTVLFCLDMLLEMDTRRLYATVGEKFIRDTSQPFSVEAVFEDLNDDELAAFPDEVNPLNSNELSVRLDVRVSDDDIDVERYFPYCGTGKSLSKTQRDMFGWTLLQAQSGLRDVRQGRKSIVDDVISEIDLGADRGDVSDIIDRMKKVLSDSNSLGKVRESLASHLSQAFPNNLERDDLEFVPGAAVDDDLMSDVRLRIREDGDMRLVHEHSDGTRALFAMAIYDLLHRGANVLAIDEPEAHLHPSSQRSLAKMLKEGDSQKILVTHSTTIAGSFEPDEIVVIRADGSATQPERGFLSGEGSVVARWWVGRQLEPLTAGIVIAVEGPSDRIVVNRVANAIGFDFDRHDVVVIETDGCGNMKMVESIFGNDGFNIPLFELVDEDNRETIAKRVGVNPNDSADLAAHHVFVSTKDLEDEYVRAIGAKKLWERIKSMGVFPNNVLKLCKVGSDGNPTEADLAEFIREKTNRKIPAALVAADLIDAANALKMKSVMQLIKAVSS